MSRLQHPNPQREERSQSTVASTSTAARPSQAAEELDNASIESSIQDLTFGDLRIFGLESPIKRWVDSYVGTAINLKNKLKRKEETLLKLEKHKEDGTFPPDLNFKFKGYLQYPKSIGEEQLEALHAKELEVVAKAQKQLLQIRLDALKKDLKKFKEDVEKIHQLTSITNEFSRVFAGDIYPASIASLIAVIINTKISLTCLESASHFVIPTAATTAGKPRSKPNRNVRKERNKEKNDTENPDSAQTFQRKQQRQQKNGSRRGRGSTRDQPPHDPRKRSRSRQSSRSNDSKKSGRSVNFVNRNSNSKSNNTYHQEEEERRERGSGRHQRSYSKR